VTSVVIDSNLYISALVFGGAPQHLFDLLQREKVRLYLSQFIIDEVSGTLVRKFGWTPENLEEFLPTLWDRCTLIRPALRLKVCGDPDDDHVLECAVAASAEYLVTGNTKHFPSEYRGVRVVTARQMIEQLETQTGE
jgi:putative PIN family toxin of toxin-antitoxin system